VFQKQQLPLHPPRRAAVLALLHPLYHCTSDSETCHMGALLQGGRLPTGLSAWAGLAWQLQESADTVGAATCLPRSLAGPVLQASHALESLSCSKHSCGPDSCGPAVGLQPQLWACG
jgi:hypothetical protein